MIRRPILLALAASVALLAGCTAPRPATPPLPAHPTPPIVFVHGNGDNAALWMTTLWRFESNGWPADRLVAIDLPYPSARDDDSIEQPGRSSTSDHATYLSAQIDTVLARTGTKQVVLVGNSRGGYAIRNYVKNFAGASRVSHAVLGGTPNHGVWAIAAFRPKNEFNGAGPFLLALNAPQGPGGIEVTPGIEWLTLRSDNNDKFAQPDGVWIGARGTATNVTFDGPALKGATNVVLPERDHREVSFHAQAFVPTFTFITGQAPATTQVLPSAKPVLDGRVFGTGPGGPNNHPLYGAEVEVYALDATTGKRSGGPRHRQSVGVDGHWGPFSADPNTAYEFVVSAPGYSTTHIYRSPFPRSSSVVNLRAERLADADRGAASVLILTRPRGYFGLPRDTIVFDGAAPPGVPAGVAGVSTSKLKLADGAGRSVAASFASGSINERIVAVAWPAAENRVVMIELTQ